MKLEFHPHAEREFIEAAEYYDQQVRGLGVQFEREVQRATELLLERPQIGAPVDRVLRRFPLTRFPFTLIYSIAREAIRIEAVAHQRRRPGYWKARARR